MQKSFILFVVLIIVITVAALIERELNYDQNDDFVALTSEQIKKQ
ncbi:MULTISPECIES: hypothetical protein [Cellulophaga]|nr:MULTISPECIES: hypothetical protein [unclassified Cellulophaga]